MPGILEICCTSLSSAKTAKRGQADRIELCDNLFEGGTTPSAGMIRQVKEKVEIDIYVLIRPRGGDFVYSDQEFDIMLMDIDYCKSIGVNGIVSGVLTVDGNIDIERTEVLVERSSPMDFTFHRAFDTVIDSLQALQDVVSTGASRILTSGLSNSVDEGADMLKALVKVAESRIIIMAGGGLKSTNIADLIDKTGCTEFHATAKRWIPGLSQHRSAVRMNGLIEIPEDKLIVASLEEVEKLRSIIDKEIK